MFRALALVLWLLIAFSSVFYIVNALHQRESEIRQEFIQLVLFFFSHDSKGNIIRKVPFLRQLFKPLRLGKGRCILGVVHRF